VGMGKSGDTWRVDGQKDDRNLRDGRVMQMTHTQIVWTLSANVSLHCD
jgi:hypothetical protein